MPAKAGIQYSVSMRPTPERCLHAVRGLLDARLRGHDDRESVGARPARARNPEGRHGLRMHIILYV
jgi:hypothetical protein